MKQFFKRAAAIAAAAVMTMGFCLAAEAKMTN